MCFSRIEHFVARVLVQADLADSEHIRPVQETGDDLQHIVRQRQVLGFLGIDAEP